MIHYNGKHLTLKQVDRILLDRSVIIRLKPIRRHSYRFAHWAFTWKLSWLQDGSMVSFFHLRMLFFSAADYIDVWKSSPLPHLGPMCLGRLSGAQWHSSKGHRGKETSHHDLTAAFNIMYIAINTQNIFSHNLNAHFLCIFIPIEMWT